MDFQKLYKEHSAYNEIKVKLEDNFYVSNSNGELTWRQVVEHANVYIDVGKCSCTVLKDLQGTVVYSVECNGQSITVVATSKDDTIEFNRFPFPINKLYKKADSNREENLERTDSARSEFRRDADRILHSPAFRRLQNKMQVFPPSETDFFRNRLTHSLYVAQIAVGITRRINLSDEARKAGIIIDEDLVEAAALAHDIGHPPFGHHGERILNRCMAEYGGFEGNAQTLRILAKLEKRSKTNGLNLTYRTLASVLKYDRITNYDAEKPSEPVKGYYPTEESLVTKIKKVIGTVKDKDFKTIECSIMDIADDIAYVSLDLEDSFKAGVLSISDLLDPKAENDEESKRKIEKIGQDFISELSTKIPIDSVYMKNPQKNLIYCNKSIKKDATVRAALISKYISDFITSARLELNESNLALSVVVLGEDYSKSLKSLKDYFFKHVIKSQGVQISEANSEFILNHLFATLAKRVENAVLDKKKFIGDLGIFPDDVKHELIAIVESTDPDIDKKRAAMRTMCDFISCMSDSYARDFHSRLTSAHPLPLFKIL